MTIKRSMTTEGTKNSTINIVWVLFVVFLVLKLTNQINWSWWWVTSPIWIPSVVSIFILSIVLFISKGKT
jgi:hypothetical protein